MQRESSQIIKNLGYPYEFVSNIEKENKTGIQAKTINYLKDLGIPDSALKQIKSIEIKAAKEKIRQDKKRKNKELLDALLKKCRRSLDAFARKGVQARIVFLKKDWIIEAPEYHPAIQHLHEVCKNNFDEYAAKGLVVTFQFTGSENWQIITKTKEEDNK